MRQVARTHTRVISALRGLSPLLKSWVELIDLYCKTQSFEDNPWFYNERATLSTLAGAAWRLDGWTALEEYSTKKLGGKATRGSVDAGELRSGRCDLYVAHRSSGFAIEAKQAWQPIWQPSNPIAHMEAAMAAAKHDARALTVEEADTRLAATFTVPFIPTANVTDKSGNLDMERAMNKVDNWLKLAVNQDHDAIAYYFTPRCSAMLSPDEKRLFPGVLLSMKLCK